MREDIEFHIEESLDTEVEKPITLYEGEYLIVVPEDQKATVVYHYVEGENEKTNDDNSAVPDDSS